MIGLILRHNLVLMNMFGRISALFFVVLSAVLLSANTSQAQEKKQDVIQFSGIVATQDTTAGILGAHVYVPKGGRGTTTNYYGYFSFPVLEGDSVVISAVGFKKQHVIIPELEGDNYTKMIVMEEDTTYLKGVDVLPYPTEEMFKEAVLAYRLPNQEDLNNMDRNMDPAVLYEIYRNMGMDGEMNHRYFTQMQAKYLFDAYGPRYNPLFNPFAWAEFFKSLKKKKKK